MSRRTAAFLFSAGVGVLLLLVTLIVWLTVYKGGASPATTEEQKVRDAILKEAGSRSAEVRFYSFEDVTERVANKDQNRLGARAVMVRFRGPLFVPSKGADPVGDFADMECVFMVIGSEVATLSKPKLLKELP